MYNNQVNTLVDPLDGINPLDVSGSLKKILTWIVMYKYKKLYLLSKVIDKKK